MQSIQRQALARLAILAVMPWTMTHANAVQVVATWGTPGTGAYATPSNWSGGQVPLNNANTSYVVQIGSGKAVTYDTPGAQTIDQLLLDVGSSFRLQSSSLISPSNLAVLGQALIAGSISADRASFTALAAGTGLLGNSTTVSATNGGVVKIGAAAFNASGLANATILNAQGAGSLVDLSSVRTLDAGQNTGYNTYITATTGGRIKLPGVTSLIAPASNASLVFTVNSGADIDLSSLQTLGGVTFDSGSTNFNLDGATVELGPLQKANRLNLNLQNASMATLGGGTGNAVVTNSLFAVSGGSRLAGSALVGTLSERGVANATILSVDGAGSLLDLSGLRTLDVGQTTGYNDFVTATYGGKIKLSGLTTLIAPASTAALVFTASGGASIDMSSLRTIGGVTSDSGSTNFNIDGASVVLGPLQKANRLNINLLNAGSLSMGGYAGSADLSNATFAVSSGAHLAGASLVGVLNERGLANVTLMSAAGSGSVLDLSGLQTLDVGQGTGYNNYVTAGSGAKIKLSGVTTLVAPASTAALVFTASGGADLDLSALRSLAGVTIDTGNTNFVLDAATAKLGPLQSANRLNVSLQNGATMTLGGYAGQASMTNATFSVASGSVLNGSSLAGTMGERGLSNVTLLSASGAGSQLNLGGIHTLDVGQGSGYNDYVTATTAAKLNLAGLTTVIAPTSSAAVVFTANSGAQINLGALQTLNTAAGGQVNFNVASGGSLLLHGLSAGPGVHFNLADAGSKLNVAGSLALLAGSTMAAGAGTTTTITGGFSFQQKVAAQVNLDAATLAFNGNGGQLLEVGSKSMGLPAANTVVTGNFALGELDVGTSDSATVLTLADLVDNGNRAGGAEALYLNGGADHQGLHILGGSVLALNGLNLYTARNGAWTHVNELFTDGVTTIAYDQGYIALTTAPVPEQSPWLMLLSGTGVLGFLRRRRAATA